MAFDGQVEDTLSTRYTSYLTKDKAVKQMAETTKPLHRGT